MADEQVVVGSPEREIHVEALVHLEKIKLPLQEQNEEEIFKMRAKLYRYHTDEKDGSSWKERGVGDIKIMKDRTKGTYRVVMRRDKTLKLCANHTVSSTMDLKPHLSSDKALVWSTLYDYADGEAKPETLCVRFGKPESATEFKKKFEEGISVMAMSKDKESSEKLANDLSTLEVKDENENTEKSDEATKKNDNDESVPNGPSKNKDTEKDDKTPSESKEPAKD